MATDPLDREVVYFGETDFRSAKRLFGIKRTDRRQHMYVVGKTGTGKTTLLHNMMVQDIMNGEGVCVIDPHGEFVETLLRKIPKEREDDVIYFNPADTDFHVGFNVLELPDYKYKHLVASGLMGIFTKIWSNVWSARMEYILNNAILALLETPGSTLLGITRLLVDKEYREKIIGNVKDPVVRAFWVHEYEEWRDQFRNEAIAPIQNKVGQFLSTALVRNIVGQSKSTINIYSIMNEGKVFLVNLSKGRIGEDNSALLGGMLITKMQLSAMERVRIPEDERVDFFLYIDEFQNFATDSFSNILSEARKYRLNLILAHQYVGQLVTDVSTKVRDAVFGNVGTMVMFRVGASDAEFLEKEFEPEFTNQDMVNLPNHSIYLKLMVGGISSRPFSAHTLPPFHGPDSSADAEEIIENSRKRYARPQAMVEREIRDWTGGTRERNEDMYDVICSMCNKETTVPFEPEEGRPVYCQDCLKKIKSGEAKPLPRFEGSVDKKVSKKSYSALSDLGIEFEQKEETPERKDKKRQPGKQFSRPPQPQKEPQKEEVLEEKEIPQEETIRLSDIAQEGSPRRSNSEKIPDEEKVKSLQEELKEALGKLNE